jgi:hypothetical protein
MNNRKRTTRPTFRILEKIGPGRQHFSILIYRKAGATEEYLEINPKFHGQYPSRLLFRGGWNRLVRPYRDAAAALEWRARKVLGRAQIKPIDFKYLTTMSVYNQQTRAVRFQRHIVAVKLVDQDLGIRYIFSVYF